MSYAEIADRLGLSEGFIGSIIRRLGDRVEKRVIHTGAKRHIEVRLR